jgi:hypothetical protein
MVCVPLALVFGIIGVVQDQRKWLGFVIALLALLLMLPFILQWLSIC